MNNLRREDFLFAAGRGLLVGALWGGVLLSIVACVLAAPLFVAAAAIVSHRQTRAFTSRKRSCEAQWILPLGAFAGLAIGLIGGAVLALFVALTCPPGRRAADLGRAAQLGSEARDIYIAVLDADASGSLAWPQVGQFANSGEYFREILQTQRVTEAASTRFATNQWCVVTGITSNCPSDAPVLFTCNLIPEPGRPDMMKNVALLEPGPEKQRVGIVVTRNYGVKLVTKENIHSEAIQKLFHTCDHPHGILRPED